MSSIHTSRIGRPIRIMVVSLETLFADSNVNSIHAPATEDTKHLINRETLKMKEDHT